MFIPGGTQHPPKTALTDNEPTTKTPTAKIMNADEYQQRAEIMKSIRDRGEQKTFILTPKNSEIIGCLTSLLEDGIVLEVPNPDPLLRTFRLRQHPV